MLWICLQDYVVALPQEYYEAYQLEEKVTKPCQVNGADSLCNQFSYLSQRRPGLFTTELETGYIIRRGGRLEDTQLFKNESVQAQLDFNAMALLDNNQVSHNNPPHPHAYLSHPRAANFNVMALFDNNQVKPITSHLHIPPL